MRACLYARVSTSDKEQNPMTQLLPLREFVKAQEWQITREYLDHASATDLYHRTGWKDLLEDASRSLKPGVRRIARKVMQDQGHQSKE